MLPGSYFQVHFRVYLQPHHVVDLGILATCIDIFSRFACVLGPISNFLLLRVYLTWTAGCFIRAQHAAVVLEQQRRSKQAMWEAELQQELELQRAEKRRPTAPPY